MLASAAAGAGAVPVRSVVTANISSHGVLTDVLSMPSFSNFIALQERRADREHLPDVQAAATRLGFTGLGAIAPDTGRGGTYGGFA
eukprot:1652303-Pyramimonas_sp.AAC.1